MDPISIATAVVAVLAPYLAEGGKAAAQKAGAALVAALERRFTAKPALREAVDDLRATPHDPDAQAALRQQLKKALAADPQLMAELAKWLEPAAPASYHAELRGSGAIAQGQGATAAGAGAVVGGQINAPVATGEGSIAASGDVVIAKDSTVQVGGIRAGRIEAENVVEGVQAQGVAPAEAAGLVELARAIRRGGITAEQIQAGSVVSGLQFIAGTAPTTPDELRREVSALRQQVEQAISRGEIVKPGDAEDVKEALNTAEAELKAPKPDGERVVRKLETANTILTRCAEVVQAAGNVGQQILKLAPIAAALWSLAQKIFGG